MSRPRWYDDARVLMATGVARRALVLEEQLLAHPSPCRGDGAADRLLRLYSALKGLVGALDEVKAGESRG